MNTVLSNDELASWCLTNVSTPRKVIGANYTKHNFKYLKRRWPDIWEQLKGKTLVIRGKTTKFDDTIKYEPLILNGVIYKHAKKYNTNSIFESYREYAKNNDTTDLDAFLRFIISKNTSGVPLLKIIKKCYTDKYKYIMNNFYENGQVERETIYRYLNNIRERPKINGIPLQFWVYSHGYLFYRQYTVMKHENITELRALVRRFIEIEDNFYLRGFLKRFYSHEYAAILNKYKHIKANGALYLYAYDLDEEPKCVHCHNTCKAISGGTIGYHLFCSLSCAYKHKRIEYAKLKFANKTVSDFINYEQIAILYTNISYAKYKDIINPNNLKREKISLNHAAYHLDHIIPLNYGFMNNIDPRVIGHYKNLQMLLGTANVAKQDNLLLTIEERDTLIKAIYECGIDYYFKADHDLYY